MATRIIWENSDGTTTVLNPVLTCINPATGNYFTIDEIATKDVPAGITTYSIVDNSILPSNRNFRNAWKVTGVGSTSATVGEDITAAREVHKTNIRNARTPKLAALDVEFQKAQETSAGITTIVAKKQALRDAPAATGIATAANTTELKAQWDTSILGTSPYS
tara:strand:- start:823 stop:1311 length:489 start_codon:yes stop_codon:yes gene_type:complete